MNIKNVKGDIVCKIPHSPFLYYLFICSHENYKNFAYQTEAQAENSVKRISEWIKNHLKSRQIDEEGRSIITQDFREFVEKMEKWDRKKMPEYCLVEFYWEIAALKQNFERPENKYNTILKSDIDFIRRFDSAFDSYENAGAKAINDKRLSEIMRGLRDRGEVKKKHEKQFTFLLKEVFPNYVNIYGTLPEIIRSKPWEEIAFGDLEHAERIKNDLQGDGRYEKVKQLFKKFDSKTAKLETDSIRDTLLEISKLLDEIYKWERYYGKKRRRDERKDNLIEYDSDDDGKIPKLHSHILAFMRWIPITPYDGPNEEVMESVDKVIDRINPTAWEIISENDNLKKILELYPSDARNIIFIQEDGKDLRKLLINAMYHEPYIRRYFHTLYKADA